MNLFAKIAGISVVFSTALLVLESGQALGQSIIPDGTLGIESSRLVRDGDRTLIVEGAERGTNLFHSFSRFGIREGDVIYFLPNNNIENIFARITGDRRSNIDGGLGVVGSANLFLLNPNGISFGYDAELDIRGSFIASTANSIVFEAMLRTDLGGQRAVV